MTVDNTLTGAAAFQIVENTGPQRTITLTARALPYRPFSLTGKQRVEVTWYPGNPEGTGTVLGADEDTCSINGFWKDMFLSSAGAGQSGTQGAPITLDGNQVSTAKDAAKLIDSVRRMGQELTVTWDEITRVGYMTEFKQEWHNLHDVQWSITFQWISQGEPTSPVVLDGGSTSDANAQLNAQNNDLNSLALPPFPTPTDFQSALQSALMQTNDAVQNAVNAGSVQATGATTPAAAAQRTFASTNAVVAGAGSVVSVLDAQPARALLSSGDPSAPSISNLGLGDITKAETYVRTTQLKARQLSRTAAIQRAALARALTSDLIGVWQANDGDDLRDVSQAFYGTRLQWRTLMIFNELTSTRLSLAQMVLVPRALPDAVGPSGVT